VTAPVFPNSVPEVLQERDQWLHWDQSNETPRRPHRAGDFGVAWSDPEQWQSFAAALGAAEGRGSWGIGYVTAARNDDHPTGVISVLDIDGAAAVTADGVRLRDWVPDLDPFIKQDAYMEWSPSRHEPGSDGCGIHIPVVGTDIPDWFSDVHFSDNEHEGVDLLSNKFCTITGDRVEESGVSLARWTDGVERWLADIHEAITGDTPPPRQGQSAPNPGMGGGNSVSTSSGYNGEEWLDEAAAADALEYIDPDINYNKWRDIGFALGSHFDTGTARRLFFNWSRGGSKWDHDAKSKAKDILNDAGEWDYGPATIVGFATRNGWEPSVDTADPPTVEELVARHSDEYDNPDDVPPDLFEYDGEDNSGAVGDEHKPPAPEDPDTNPWDGIYQAYRSAEDADERQVPRHEAATQLLEEGSWRTLQETDQIYHYDDSAGIFRPTGETDIRERLVDKLAEQYRKHEQNEIKAQVRGQTTVPQEDLGGPAWYICTENCVLEVTPEGDIKRHEHSPGYDFLGRVQTSYDPDADCPRFQQFLDESVQRGSDKKKLQEFAGYALYHWGLPFHKSLFLVGPTASGKSTFLDTIRTMLGDDSVASLTPQQMTSERFGGAELFGTWANIRNDIPNELIENTGQFKEIVGGDPIKAEKKYEDPFMFEPAAKHMFSANELPEASTDDRAFYRRILLVAFPHETPRAERDPRLDEKLQAEHPGTLNWALDGLLRLIDQGGFTADRDPWQTEETWEKWSDSAKRFYQACLADDSGNDLPTGDAWQAYLEYCQQEGIPAKSRQAALTKALKSQGIETGRAYFKDEGRQKRSLLNVGWTSRGKELFEAAQSDDDTGSGSSTTRFDDYGS